MQRPSWLNAAVACWGEPSVDRSTPFTRKRPNPETGRNQVEYVREWSWDNGAHIEIWGLGRYLRDRLAVVEAYGPLGTALRTAPGMEWPPLAAVVLTVASAGVPIDHELLVTAVAALTMANDDLTAQWRPTNVSSTATPDTEGAIMGQPEHVESETVNESNEVAEDTAEGDGVADEQ